MTLTPESSTLDSHDALFCLHCTNSCTSSHQVVKLLESAGTAALISDGRGPTHRWQINIWRPMQLFLNFRRPRHPERLLLGIIGILYQGHWRAAVYRTGGLAGCMDTPPPILGWDCSPSSPKYQIRKQLLPGSCWSLQQEQGPGPPCETAFHPHSIIFPLIPPWHDNPSSSRCPEQQRKHSSQTERNRFQTGS